MMKSGLSMTFKNRVALVTGAGTGIGRATAEAFAREGAGVAVNYSKSAAEAEAVAAGIRDRGGKAIAVQADVSREADVIAMMERIEREFGRLDILVNNAGWSTRVPHEKLWDLTDEIWDKTLNTNLRGMFYCVRAAVTMLRRNEGAAVVNIASAAGPTGMGSSMVYAASKGAMITMTKSLARALAPQVRVNAVAPGFVRTRFAGWPSETFDYAATISPMGRIATVDEVAEAVLFLSGAGSGITGETIGVDGGMTALGKK
jgi:3-oxoacyl-[acyl-carrier protein] reductase